MRNDDRAVAQAVRNEDGDALDTTFAGTVWRVPDIGEVPYGFGNTLGKEIGRAPYVERVGGMRHPVQDLDCIYLELEDGRLVTLERRHLVEGDEWDQLAYIARAEECLDYQGTLKTMSEAILAWRALRDTENQWITGGEIVKLVYFPWFEQEYARLAETPLNLVSDEDKSWLRRFAYLAANKELQDALMSLLATATGRVVSTPREEGGNFYVEILSTDEGEGCEGCYYPDEEPDITGWYEIVRREHTPPEDD